MKICHNLNFIYSWKLVYFLFIYKSFIFTHFTHFTSFMQNSCIFTYIFRIFLWLQNTHIRLNQNKIFKNRVFVKILQIRYLIIFILRTQSYEFFFKTVTLFLIFEFDYTIFFFYEKRRVSHEKKSFTWKKKKKSFISLSCYSALIHSDSNSLNIVEYEAWNLYHLEHRWL